MIADLKPYGAYKDSGLAWLGQVPEHWGQRRMKFLFEERSQKGFPDEPLLAATQTKGVVRKKDYGKRTVTAMKDFHLLKLVEIGDFVISLRSFEGGIEVSHCRGIISPAYTVLTPSADACLGYYAHFFKSSVFIRSLTLFVTGIREGQNIDYERMSRAYMPLPPLEEQIAIGKFLDWANARLERTIRAKRRVIALLNEQKQAIIHRAVTRGLDPNAPLKPSGIAWLGDIPAHWEVLALKRVLRRLIDCEHKTAPKIDDGGFFHVVRTTAVRGGQLRQSGTYCTTPEAFFQWTRRGLPEAGDVIFTREAPAGEACEVPEGMKFCLGQRTVLMKTNKQRLNSQFLIHSIYAGSARTAITLATQGSTVGHFNMSDIGILPILLPPKSEQDQIINGIEAQTVGLVAATARLQAEIDLLREYRTRLVADVVTGKLDVREAAAALPVDDTLLALEPDALDADTDADDDEATEAELND
jgi:type I restriction enzyme S subunit